VLTAIKAIKSEQSGAFKLRHLISFSPSNTSCASNLINRCLLLENVFNNDWFTCNCLIVLKISMNCTAWLIIT